MKRSRRRTRESESTTTCLIANLPKEVLIDILSRLSIKTILICRCVSKTWYNLLSSSNTHFTKLHFTRSPVQVIIQPPNSRLSIVELNDDTDLENNSIQPIPSRFKLPRCPFVVINSCNGFLNLALFHNLYGPVKICNPITGEYLNLPKQKMCDYFERYVVSGFGLCAKTNKYKVVRLMHRDGLFKDRVVQVYTIGGTKSWETIGTAPKYPKFSYCTTFFNGKIHWVCDDSDSSDFIITFDLETEKFGNVPSPPHFSVKWRYEIRIGVLGEFLCLSYYRESWVMKEYGSWTKVGDDSPVRSLQAIKYLSDGKLLMNYDDRELGCYDPVKEISKKFEITQSPWCFETIAHVPSFMSFNDAMMGDKGAKLRTGMCRVQRRRRN